MLRILPSDDPTAPLLQSARVGLVAAVDESDDARQDADDELHRPVLSLEKWNEPHIKVWRVLATFFSFIVVGANDGTYGALVHYLGEYYEVDYATVSVVFLSPCIGYATAALVNNCIHAHLGQRGVAVLGSGFHIIAYAISSQHPPFAVLLFLYVVAGLGNGLPDAAWNAWIATMADSSTLMGILQGFYGLGAALAPITITSLITKRGWEWYEHYYIMVAGAIIEIFALTTAFWSAGGSHIKVKEHPHADDGNWSRMQSRRSWSEKLRKSPTVQSLGTSSTWIICLFIFVYAGVEITVGGWGATISPRVINCQLLQAQWLRSTVEKAQLSRKSLQNSYPLERTEAFAAICMLESGSVDLEPESLNLVFAISVGDSLYIAAPLLGDPGATKESHAIRRVIGNVGRAGITLLIPTETSEIREFNPESRNLINHNEFDGKLEDTFASTSLHIRFTGYDLPVDTGNHGTRFVEVSFAEAVIAVHESGEWVADIDVLKSLNSIRLHSLVQQERCPIATAGTRPGFEVIAVEKWDEVLNPPGAQAVFKTHGNWQARLAAVCISVARKHHVILFGNHGCWDCGHKVMLDIQARREFGHLPSEGPDDIIFVL